MKRIERAAPKLVLRLTVAGGGDLNRCAVYLPTTRRRHGRRPQAISWTVLS